MSKHEEKNESSRPLVNGILLFVFLFLMLFSSIFLFDYSTINVHALAFILAVACIVFLAKSVYEVSSGPEKIKRQAENMANKLVASSQQLFLEVYNNSPVAYLLVDKNGSIVSANTASARLFGQAPEVLARRDFFALIETMVDEHKAILKQKFKQGVSVSEEEVKVMRGKNISWTTLSIFQFSNSDGRTLSLITLVDITKQKEVDTAKSEFVSLASHQLRTPISGMRWSAELLLLDGVETLSTSQKRYIDRLLSSINRMSGLIDDFLQVSRFELGTRIVKYEDVNLEDLVDDIIAEKGEVVISKKLKIVKDLDPSIKTLSTDMGMLRMIISNLYVNAVKYSRNEGEVTVSYRKKGEELTIEVKDNGMGIPVSEQKGVFSKIFRATNAVKEVPDGTGLGLYIVEKSVQELRGRISFVSAQDVGTTFTVVLPIA